MPPNSAAVEFEFHTEDILNYGYETEKTWSDSKCVELKFYLFPCTCDAQYVNEKCMSFGSIICPFSALSSRSSR